MNRKVIQRLIWKDGRTLAPLALATLASIIGLNLLLVALASWGIIRREQLIRPPRSVSASWYGASIGRARPGKMRALLWQASRQSFWTLVLLTIVASIGVIVALGKATISAELAGLISGVALFAIAGLTFYGDSVRKRCVFLSDRGVSPTLVWRTRLIPTALAMSLVVAATMIRNAALFGDATFKQVAHVAERADEIVATVLEEQLTQLGMTPEIEELIHLFPDNHLVLQSRRNSLIVAWKKYRQSSDPWIQFSGIFHRPRPFLWPNLELLRRQRFTDQTIKMAEQHWRSGALSGLSELPEFYRDSREAGLWDVMGPLQQLGVRERIENLKGRIQ